MRIKTHQLLPGMILSSGETVEAVINGTVSGRKWVTFTDGSMVEFSDFDDHEIDAADELIAGWQARHGCFVLRNKSGF